MLVRAILSDKKKKKKEKSASEKYYNLLNLQLWAM